VDPDGPRIVIFGPTQESIEAARERLEFVTHRVSVQPEQMGWLIGRNGRNFRELQEKTKVTRLNIDKGSGQVVLVGTKSAVEAALLYMDTHLQYLSQFESEARESEKLRQELRGMAVGEDDGFNGGGKGGRGGRAEGRGGGRGRGGGFGRGGGARDGPNGLATHAYFEAEEPRATREQPMRDGQQRGDGKGGGTGARGKGGGRAPEPAAPEVETAPGAAGDKPPRGGRGGKGVTTRGASGRGSGGRGGGRANGYSTPTGA
jgi:predicted RNA-binding protein YlqC (UPF0109 family)